jgi:hypothetical protein
MGIIGACPSSLIKGKEDGGVERRYEYPRQIMFYITNGWNYIFHVIFTLKDNFIYHEETTPVVNNV